MSTNSLVNSCRFTGRLGKKPELTYTAKNDAKFSAGLAVDMRRPQGDGEWGDETTWVNFTAFGKTAERLDKVTETGMELLIDCEYRRSDWTDNEGNKQYSHDFIVRDFKPYWGKSESGSGNGGGGRQKESAKPVTKSTLEQDDLSFSL